MIEFKLYSTSLKATVSLRGLQTYCENKGIEIEFKGQLFAANLKVQELNEAAEFQSIRHLIEMSNELLKKSIDYEIKISDPVAVNNSELFRIKYEISCFLKFLTPFTKLKCFSPITMWS